MKLLLLRLAIIACIFPYNSILIFAPSDMQPWALIFTISFLFCAFLLSKTKFYFSAESIFFSLSTFTLIVIYTVLFLPKEENYLNYLRSVFGYLSVPIFFILGQGIHSDKIFKFITKTLEVSIIVYLIGMLYQFIFSDSILLGVFKPRGKESLFGHYGRGISGLLPEPSFVPFIVMVIFLFQVLLSYKEKKKYIIYINLIASLTLILFSYAGYTIVVLLCLLLAFSLSSLITSNYLFSFYQKLFSHFNKLFFKHFIKLFILLLLILTIIFLFDGSLILNSFSSSRVFNVSTKLFSSDSKNSYELIVNTDASLQDRVIAFTIPFVSLFYNPIGFGIANTSDAFKTDQILNSTLNLAMIQKSNLYEGISTSRLMSTIGNYLVDFGFLGLFSIFTFFVCIFNKILHQNQSNKLSKVGVLYFGISFFILFNLFGHYPLAFPLPWFLLGLLTNKYFIPYYKPTFRSSTLQIK